MTEIINWVIIKLSLTSGVKTVHAFNNSPLPKGDLNNQELKTKGTIWKPLIAVSLLSVFSFTAGQYLPYVIAAVSGSGAIAAVPLAIFAVSTVVALVLATYLIKLAVSRASSKKEAGPDGKKPGHTASQEPQKFVCENCTNLESKPIGKECDKSVKQGSETQTEVRGSEHVDTITSQQPPLTLGTAIPQNNNASSPSPSGGAPPPPPPPLPPGGLKNWNPPKNNTTGEKSPVGTTQKNASLAKFTLPKGSNQAPVSQDDILQMRKKLRKPGAKEGQKQDGGDNNSMDIGWILARRVAMKLSDNEDEHENDSDISNDEWDESNDKHSIPKNPQLDSNKRRNSSDSDYGSGSELTSSSNPVPKAGKPPVPPKPANLKTGPQAPSATTVTNEAGKLPASSVKERCGMFGGADTKFKRGSVLVR
ncbi:MAG: hypothetical protein LBP77_02805 [Rickettsiales bacterium]|nr:hypothetical protein [Rickettsiales bacterium]